MNGWDRSYFLTPDPYREVATEGRAWRYLVHTAQDTPPMAESGVSGEVRWSQMNNASHAYPILKTQCGPLGNRAGDSNMTAASSNIKNPNNDNRNCSTYLRFT